MEFVVQRRKLYIYQIENNNSLLEEPLTFEPDLAMMPKLSMISSFVIPIPVS